MDTFPFHLGVSILSVRTLVRSSTALCHLVRPFFSFALHEVATRRNWLIDAPTDRGHHFFPCARGDDAAMAERSLPLVITIQPFRLWRTNKRTTEMFDLLHVNQLSSISCYSAHQTPPPPTPPPAFTSFVSMSFSLSLLGPKGTVENDLQTNVITDIKKKVVEAVLLLCRLCFPKCGH